MKRNLFIFGILLTIVAIWSYPQAQTQTGKKDDSSTSLNSEKLTEDGKSLDGDIIDYVQKTSKIIQSNDLMNAKGIRVLPYQVSYSLGNDYIIIEKHGYLYTVDGQVCGVKKKRVKVYYSGSSISKIESEIYESNFKEEQIIKVNILDPSPSTEGTDDIVFTHIVNGKAYIDNKKLGDIKNTTAFPIRNDMKRSFMIPMYAFMSDTLLDIAETYSKGIKDSDSQMMEFLKKSTKY